MAGADCRINLRPCSRLRVDRKGFALVAIRVTLVASRQLSCGRSRVGRRRVPGDSDCVDCPWRGSWGGGGVEEPKRSRAGGGAGGGGRLGLRRVVVAGRVWAGEFQVTHGNRRCRGGGLRVGRRVEPLRGSAGASPAWVGVPLDSALPARPRRCRRVAALTSSGACPPRLSAQVPFYCIEQPHPRQQSPPIRAGALPVWVGVRSPCRCESSPPGVLPV